MSVNTDVLETYEFHIQISEEDVRDGDAIPWERVVAALAAEVRATREALATIPICGIYDMFHTPADALSQMATYIRELREKLAAQEPEGRPGARCGHCALRVEAGPLAGECHYDPDPRPENAACEFFEERT